ncbi:hypothetical protein CHS0354_035227 [Potamilus streckersoni]|uniref:Lauroyl acyltransferase n=1 Tax=Potamilus streckersoni TaxID=2493646 RepID=A0AAE0VP95_9BIVA|nr:hypothetical protein CHS0354_035227 [Potamilus streckersoni]
MLYKLARPVLIVFFIISVALYAATFPFIKKRRTLKEKADEFLLALVLAILPKNRMQGLEWSEKIFRLFYKLGLGKKKVLVNLNIAFGKTKSPDEIESLAKQVYRHWSYAVFDILYFRKIERAEIDAIFQIDTPEIYEEIKKVQQEKGILLLTYHFGNSIATCYTGLIFENMYGYITTQTPLVDSILEQIRERFDKKITLYKKSAYNALQIMKALKSKKILSMAADFDVAKSDMFIPFFGTPASTPRGIYYFPVRSGCAVYLLFILRSEDHRYHFQFKKLTWADGQTEEETCMNIASAYFHELELMTERYPEHYMWFNSRWRTRPPGDDTKFYA